MKRNFDSRLKRAEQALVKPLELRNYAKFFEDWTTDELKEYVHHFELGTPVSEEILKKADIVASKIEQKEKQIERLKGR